MPYQDGQFGCPVEVGLQMVSGKWKPRILYALQQRTKRFGELQREVAGVSRHVLTTQLRELEASGLIHRQVYGQVPPKVEYSLTELGNSLTPILEQMIKIGEHYISTHKTDSAVDV